MYRVQYRFVSDARSAPDSIQNVTIPADWPAHWIKAAAQQALADYFDNSPEDFKIIDVVKL